jgi:hypothetical protein
MRKSNQSLFRIVALLAVFTLAGVLSVKMAEASVKINAGDLLKIILDEAAKDNNKAENTPVPANDSTRENSTDDVADPLRGEIIKVFPGVHGEYDRPPVKVRSAPNSEGKVIDEVYGDDGSDILVYFFVDATPIQDKKSKSLWYKIVLYDSGWFPLQVDKPSFFLHQSTSESFSYLYVNTQDVKKETLTPRDKEQIEWLKQGRPPKLKIEDFLDPNKIYFRRYYWGQYKTTFTKFQLHLRQEPNFNSKTFALHKGTLIYDPYSLSWHGGSVYKPIPLGLHVDMEEKQWLPLFDGKTNKVLGWVDMDEDIGLDDPLSQEVFEDEKLLKQYQLNIEYLDG